jgi:hypothetical protein
MTYEEAAAYLEGLFFFDYEDRDVWALMEPVSVYIAPDEQREIDEADDTDDVELEEWLDAWGQNGGFRV